SHSRAPPSFPTRRSSDLGGPERGERRIRAGERLRLAVRRREFRRRTRPPTPTTPARSPRSDPGDEAGAAPGRAPRPAGGGLWRDDVVPRIRTHRLAGPVPATLRPARTARAGRTARPRLGPRGRFHRRATLRLDLVLRRTRRAGVLVPHVGGADDPFPPRRTRVGDGPGRSGRPRPDRCRLA